MEDPNVREHIARQLKELERYGVKPSVERTKGGHIRIRWGARQLYASSTPSDNRAVMNNVAIIRQWMREDNIPPQDERLPIRERIKTHEQGKVKLGPLLAYIENLEAQLKELFAYVTDPTKALTEEPQAVSEGKRVPSTDLLQYLNETDWTPAAKLAIKWARPHANVQSALKQLELKGLVVNYKGVGWKRTPPQAVQIKVTPIVIEAAAPATSWLVFFSGIRWTTAKQFAVRAKIDREEALEVIRSLERAGWLEHSEKHGWRKHHKRQQQAVERPAWGGVTHGVPSSELLELMHYSAFEELQALASKWGRSRDKTASALSELRKRGLVQNKRGVGWRRVKQAPAKANGKHHMSQEHQQQQ